MERQDDRAHDDAHPLGPLRGGDAGQDRAGDIAVLRLVVFLEVDLVDAVLVGVLDHIHGFGEDLRRGDPELLGRAQIEADAGVKQVVLVEHWYSPIAFLRIAVEDMP